MRRNKPNGLDIPSNPLSLIREVLNHSETVPVVSNQCDPEYTTYDIGVSEDLALHAKYYPIEEMFRLFHDHPKAKASFATKYVNTSLLPYAHKKIRIRFSLMPEALRKHLEPNTSTISDRIEAIRIFREAGYEVHINFSPVIVFPKWLDYYKDLFQQVAPSLHNDEVKAEVIFLTHSEKLHNYNINNNIDDSLLWNPKYQRKKNSNYQSNVLIYSNKSEYIEQFKELHHSIIPNNEIRYIF